MNRDILNTAVAASAAFLVAVLGFTGLEIVLTYLVFKSRLEVQDLKRSLAPSLQGTESQVRYPVPENGEPTSREGFLAWKVTWVLLGAVLWVALGLGLLVMGELVMILLSKGMP